MLDPSKIVKVFGEREYHPEMQPQSAPTCAICGQPILTRADLVEDEDGRKHEIHHTCTPANTPGHVSF